MATELFQAPDIVIYSYNSMLDICTWDTINTGHFPFNGSFIWEYRFFTPLETEIITYSIISYNCM